MSIHWEVENIVSPVYQVGGSVRDELMGREPHDYDFATPLTPDEIEAAVRAGHRRPYLVGKRYGTIGFKVDGNMVEVTTFRNEKYKPGYRKPEVSFVKDITADLSRRDFTINAIAKRHGKYIDPFGGRQDILRKKIICVNKPKDRFKEDPLRMLRAARFASQLDFTIDEYLFGIARQLSHKILEVSRERWIIEMDKLLITDKPSVGLEFLAQARLLNFMVPELALQVGYDQNSKYHDYTLWEHTKMVVDDTPKDITLRWAALLHDIAKPFVRTDKKGKDYSNYIKHDLLGGEMVQRIALHLKWSNDRREQVSEIVKNHLQDNSPLREADNKHKRDLKG